LAKVRNSGKRSTRGEVRSQPIVPGQNAKPPKAIVKQSVCPHCVELMESVDTYNDVSEWLGFNYKEYVKNIESFTVISSLWAIYASPASMELSRSSFTA